MRRYDDTLRLRAGEFASSMRRVGSHVELELPHRGRLSVGERVRIEVSFGPMADEIDVFGEVQDTNLGSASIPRGILVRLDADSLDQVRYIEEVLGGGREAAARRHRRLPSSLGVRWTLREVPQVTHLLDISAGGAFIVSDDLPEVGQTVQLQLRTGDLLNPLRLESVVSWVRPAQASQRRGFGVSFKLPDANSASRLGQVVRAHERAFTEHGAA